MSFMRKEDRTSIVTPLPASVDHFGVIAALHDHQLIINLSPAVESHKLIKGNAQMSAEYSVVDRKPIGKTTYELTITNRNDGADTEVSAHPPLGLLKVWSQWRVSQKGSQGGWVLQEDVRIEANRAMVGMVKGNIEKTHKEQHEKIVESAKGNQGANGHAGNG